MEFHRVIQIITKDTGEIPSHTKLTFNEHDILTVHNLILYQTMTTMSKIYRNIAPTAIISLFAKTVNATIPQGRRTTINYFDIHRTRLVSEDRTIFNKGPRLFNSLVNTINKIIVAENLKLKDDKHKHRQLLLQNKFTDSFKTKLKTYLISRQKHGNTEFWAPENFVIYT